MAVRTSRLDQMEEYIRKHDFVPLDDLCVAFQRSKITIRRDLSMLEEKGVIEKVWGRAPRAPRYRTSRCVIYRAKHLFDRSEAIYR